MRVGRYPRDDFRNSGTRRLTEVRPAPKSPLTDAQGRSHSRAYMRNGSRGTDFSCNWSLSNRRPRRKRSRRSEEHTSELQSLMRISYAVFCLKKKKKINEKRIKKMNKNKRNNTTKYKK